MGIPRQDTGRPWTSSGAQVWSARATGPANGTLFLVRCCTRLLRFVEHRTAAPVHHCVIACEFNPSLALLSLTEYFSLGTLPVAHRISSMCCKPAPVQGMMLDLLSGYAELFKVFFPH